MVVMYCLICAVSSVLSTIGMKYWDSFPKIPVAIFIGLTLSVAVWSEIQALRQAELVMTFIIIIGLEVSIAFAASYWFLGESFSSVKFTGACLVLIGVAMIQTAPLTS